MQLDNVEDVFPLSPTQSGMLYHCIAEPQANAYVSQVELALSGPLDVGVFEQAWGQVMQRHASLRSLFVWDGVDEPLQVIRQSLDPVIERLDYRSRDKAQQGSALLTLKSRALSQPFDLTRAPLMRLSLVQLSEQDWHLVWTFHHLLMDGWSSHQVLAELRQLYEAGVDGRLADLAPAPDWKSYIGWRNQRQQAVDRSFWKSLLAGFDSPNRLPRPPQLEAGSGEDVFSRHSLTVQQTAAIQQLARDLRLTPSTLVHAAWGLLLSRYCDAEDIVFGSTQSGRPADLEGVEHMVGMFINTLPLRVRANSDQSTKAWLQALQQQLTDIRDRQADPLVKVQACSDVPGGSNLFDSIVVFENYPAQPETQGSLSMRLLDQREKSHYPLALLAVPGEQLELILVHNTRRYSFNYASELLLHLGLILSNMGDYLDQPVARIPVLPQEYRDQLVRQAQGTSLKSPALLLTDRLQQLACQKPDQTALICGKAQMDWQTLDTLAGQFAARLQANGVRPASRVGICVNRGVNMIVAIQAIHRCGAAYVPLDAAYPVDRLHWQLQASECSVVLTDSETGALLSDCGCTEISMDESPGPDIGEPVTVTPDMPAYVIFTSGSSGRPKGVEVSHGALAASTAARQDYYSESPGVFLMMSSLAFDSSVAGIFWSLASGGTLVISTPRLEQDMALLAQTIADHGVTHLLCLPTLYDLLLQQAAAEQLQSLRHVMVAGEALSAAGLISRHREQLPQTRLYNEYGPTEAAVWATACDVTDIPESLPVPIGGPIAGYEVWVLDKQNRPCPAGLPGEICIGGAGLASRYLGAEAEDQQRFMDCQPVPGEPRRLYRSGDQGCLDEQGRIHFQGRMDQQVKIRGFRIEPDEVARNLVQCPGVAEAAVVARPAGRLQALDDAALEQLAMKMLALGEAQVEALLKQ